MVGNLEVIQCCYLCIHSPFKSRKGVLKREATCSFLTEHTVSDVVVSPFSRCKNWLIDADRFDKELDIILANK